MKGYTKKYMAYFGYDESSWIPCECGCGRQAVDIHHLEPRSLNKKRRDDPENLCALTRECHEEAGRSRSFNEMLKTKHRRLMLVASKKENIIIRIR